MEVIAIFTSAFVVAFSGAMMPGPLLTVTINESARRGFLAGPLLILGHATLEFALILALAAGLSAFLTKTSVSHTIAVLGGAFLIYMGWGIARDAYTGKVSLKAVSQVRQGDGSPVSQDNAAVKHVSQASGLNSLYPVLAGILFSVSNPYWLLWWATIGLGYITLSMQKGVLGLSLFFSGHILADLVWYSLVSAAVAGGIKFLSDKIYRGILAACGIFLLVLGGGFIYYGIFT
ncbi:LysE family transporter [Pelotomaculum propionicicum]|uniref:Threonine efflux protein n=1 Tax=Pelotomaculum propionicicum TaxID=258475 RepID=A0A4Y7RR30_9FIRM|nr:LysE family transporter [Pelotomaculum propionicicum]NLI11813.1 LysE family transporter [Peptococcaceae bacterium]TEB11323.1 hypothetical protein Pmgp_01686 [Pelotomaculum propionicicum]